MRIIKVFTILYIFAMLIVAIDGLILTKVGDKKSVYAIVYGSEVLKNGEPSKRLQARLDKSYDLYKWKIVKKIIVSGGFGESGYEEAKVMHKYLIKKKVPFPHILIDMNGYTTQLTSNNVFLLTKEKGNYPNVGVIGVSQYFHISRVKLSLKKAGFVNVGGVSADYHEWRDVYSLAREVPAYISYFFKGLGKDIDVKESDIETIKKKIIEKIKNLNN